MSALAVADPTFQEIQERDWAAKPLSRLDRNQRLEGAEKSEFDSEQNFGEVEEASLHSRDLIFGRWVMKREGSLVADERLQKAKAKLRKDLLSGASIACGSDLRPISTVSRSDVSFCSDRG